MPLFFSKDNSESINPEFLQRLTIGRKITNQRIAVHVVYWAWTAYGLYGDFNRMLKVSPELPVSTELHWYMFLSHMFITIATYYLVGYLVLPSLIKAFVYYQATRSILRKRIAFMVLAALLVYSIYNVYDYYVFGYAVDHFKPVPGFIERNAKYVVDLGPFGFLTSEDVQSFIWAFNLSYLFLPCSLRLIRWLTFWGVDNLKRQEQNQKLIKNQLKYLQDQVNPHFLFNVLNNLYALIHRTHNEAGLLLRRLIELLKYTLYRTHENFVELKEELLFLKNYVEIEQSRLRDPTVIRFVQNGNISGQIVPPLLLLTFIENAFKHGIHNSYDGGWIDIKIDILENPSLLRVDIKNPISRESVDKSKSDGGLGLFNAEQRLNLLFKPNEYKFIISEQADVYRVQLEIPLYAPTVAEYEHESN